MGGVVPHLAVEMCVGGTQGVRSYVNPDVGQPCFDGFIEAAPLLLASRQKRDLAYLSGTIFLALTIAYWLRGPLQFTAGLCVCHLMCPPISLTSLSSGPAGEGVVPILHIRTLTLGRGDG